jgi:hypothetical protein
MKIDWIFLYQEEDICYTNLGIIAATETGLNVSIIKEDNLNSD